MEFKQIDFGALDVEVRYDEPLKKYTGFATGGNARAVVAPKTRDSFIETITLLRKNDAKFTVLGFGSNVLAADAGYNGYVVLTKQALGEILQTGDRIVYSGAGASLSALCRFCQQNALAGLEFAFGIPGSVGGAVFMNAGAFGGEIKDVIVSVHALDAAGNVVEISAAALALGYRTSMFQRERGYIILGATFELSYGSKQDIQDRMNLLMERRQQKQPLNYPSCGSTFKRPDGNYASKLIDESGLRGFRIGDAAVSDKHCGFIVNMANASTDDILDVINHVREVVEQKTGYRLECEIEYLG